MVEKRKELLAKVHKGKMQQGGTRERCVRHPGHKIEGGTCAILGVSTSVNFVPYMTHLLTLNPEIQEIREE